MNFEKMRKYSGLKLISFIFETLMAGVYLALSVILLFTSYFHNFVGGLRISLGIILGLYGLYRVYRAYVKIKEKDE